ncbi:MAG: 1-(5-phosphoribosyl)-5-[(5-phosphoribosylamino)methylideneamino]imidazole-4-carboxamide isomerase [Candidatus Bathyarchaeia archaeon]
MILIPAVDLMRGRCVRLFQGDPSKPKQYYQDPLEAAMFFRSQGAEMLHIVDLDAALGLGDNAKVISKIVKSIQIRTQVGGGIRTLERAKEILDLGVSRAIFGTAAVKKPELISEVAAIFGRERIAAAIDVKNGSPAIEGWRSKTSLEYISLAQKLEAAGAGCIVFTSVNADGTLSGPALSDVKRLVRSVTVPVIASGGVRNLEDIAALAKTGVQGVIVGTALYENRFSLRQALKVAEDAG